MASRNWYLATAMVVITPAYGEDPPSIELLEFIGEWEAAQVTATGSENAPPSLWQRWLDETDRSAGDDEHEDN